MIKARLTLVEEKFGDANPPNFEVRKIQNSAKYTIGQTLTRDEVQGLIARGAADVNILPRKDQ